MEEDDQDFDILPVEEHKDEILKAVRENQVVVCIGETGSGKTTRIPQYLHDARIGGDSTKIIGITQPRQIAAISVAERVCDERRCRMGDEVGYTIRFDDKTSSATRIKFMTDGILIRECLSDPLLNRYAVIMLDEAHERSLNTDILFGLLKRACKQRADLKLLITSATLEASKLQDFFWQCPLINIPGRVFPVDIYHSKTRQVMTVNGPANNLYVQAAVDVVVKIHAKDEDGHILVFLTGQEEIERACALLRTHVRENPMDDRELIILPLYAALSPEQQAKVFKKPSLLVDAGSRGQKLLLRKCVVATNIAETSITVPHVRFVVDAGYVKQKVFDPERNLESLVVVPISKTSALQRAGRAGRTSSGQAYRLYTTSCFDNFAESAVPEIQRTSLAHVVLLLKGVGVGDVLGFDFLEAPSREQVEQALVLLHQLGALDDLGAITSRGRVMGQLPLDPRLSRAILEAASSDAGCLSEVLSICALLCVENIWMRPSRSKGARGGGAGAGNFDSRVYGGTGGSGGPGGPGGAGPRERSPEEERAEVAHAGLRHPWGDFLTLLNVFQGWQAAGAGAVGWAQRHYLNVRGLKTAEKIKGQLDGEVRKLGVDKSRNSSSIKKEDRSGEDDADGDESTIERRVSACLTPALFMHSAALIQDNMFKLSGSGELVYLSPQSALSHYAPPSLVVYMELVRGDRLYMRVVGRVSKKTLKSWQKSYKSVPVAQLSSGTEVVVNSKKRARDGEGDVGSSSLSRGAVFATGNSGQEGAASVPESAAVLAARMRYLNRKK